MTNLFTFDGFKNFDNHISSSIPTLGSLDVLAAKLVHDFAQDDTYVVDLGCSTGRFLKSVKKQDGVQYVGIDKTMVDSNGFDCTNQIQFIRGDIITTDLGACSVVVSLFTLQFMPMHKRAVMIDKIRDSLVSGGIFICAEKTHCVSPRVEASLQGALMEHKRKTFSDTDIVEKQISLTPVMHLQTESVLVEELKQVGDVSTVWCWGGFRCFVVENRK